MLINNLHSKILFWLVRHIKILRDHAIFNVSVLVGDKVIKIPIIRGAGINTIRGADEPAFKFFLKRLVQEADGTFIDVGANIGQTLLKVVEIGSDRSYIGFEVHNFCCFYLEELIRLNRLDRHVILPVGLYSESNVAPLLAASPKDAGATVEVGFRPRKRYSIEKYVYLEKGDNIINRLDIRKIAVIKIDVEGAELQVLLGLQNTIRKYTPFIIVEILPVSHMSGDYSLAEEEREKIVHLRSENIEKLQDLIEQLSYVAFRMLPNKSLERTCDFDIDGKFDLALCNYLLVPQESIDGISDLVASRKDLAGVQ